MSSKKFARKKKFETLSTHNSRKTPKKTKTSSRIKKIKNELRMLESRLENSEFKKTMLEEENTEILRRTADFVELERLKRENAERELDLVEKELQNINNKSYLGKKREFVNK